MAQYANPMYYSGPRLEKCRMRAKDSQTWQAGQFMRATDSGLVLCKSAAVSIQYLTAETQVTSTSNSDVYVYRIPAGGTKFVIGVTSAGSDAKPNPTMIGGNFGIGVNSCVCTISRGCDTAAYESLHVENIMYNVEGIKNDTSTSGGYVIASVIESVRTVEGAGV